MPHLAIADLTVDEFKIIIHDTIKQTFAEIFNDPDNGLALQEDFAIELKNSLATFTAASATKPAHEIAAKLGLNW